MCEYSVVRWQQRAVNWSNSSAHNAIHTVLVNLTEFTVETGSILTVI